MAATRAAFFFGSGISFPSGMPSVSGLTDAALHGDWHLHTDQNFYPGVEINPAFVDNTTPPVKDFLQAVRGFAAEYLSDIACGSKARDPHYEDLFSLAEQASRTESNTIPNLAVVEFQKRLKKSTEPIHQNFSHGTTGVDGFAGLAETACEYLHWVVHHTLSAVAGPPSGLDLVSEVAAAVEELDIFTLNHDCLVEQQLLGDGIDRIGDGFNDVSHGEVRVFSGWDLTSRTEKVRLFKLHGSLNWYLYDFPGWARQYAVPTTTDPFHCHDEQGNLVTPVEWKAAFLSGTVVKEQRYGLGFWGNLINAFREHLGRHSRLICCGYGFGDVGINQRLHQWAYDRPGRQNRLLILSPEEPVEFLRGKPYWLTDLWQNKQLKFVPAYLQHCSLSDIESHFDA